MSPFTLLVLTLLSAGQQTPSGTRIELSFTRVIVQPGKPAALPIYLVADDVYPGPLQVTLEFDDKQLKFQKVELAYLSIRAKWKVTGSVKPHPDKTDRRVLQIDLVPDPSTYFPSGAVAHAHFLVSKSVQKGAVLLDAALVAPAGSRPVAAAEPAKIIVTTEPLFGCFFYMH
jgi:hypothetical protein